VKPRLAPSNIARCTLWANIEYRFKDMVSKTGPQKKSVQQQLARFSIGCLRNGTS
jgi:hypothetical protein